MKGKYKEEILKVFKAEEFYEKEGNGGHGKYVGERSREIENNPEYTKEHFFHIKAEIEMYEKEKCEGAIVRSREHRMRWRGKVAQSTF